MSLCSSLHCSCTVSQMWDQDAHLFLLPTMPLAGHHPATYTPVRHRLHEHGTPAKHLPRVPRPLPMSTWEPEHLKGYSLLCRPRLVVYASDSDVPNDM